MTRSTKILVLLVSILSLAAAAPTASAANDLDSGRRPYAAPAAMKVKAQPDAARIKYGAPDGTRVKFGRPDASPVRIGARIVPQTARYKH